MAHSPGPGQPGGLAEGLDCDHGMVFVLVGEGSPDVPQSLHMTTLLATLLTPVDEVTVSPHYGPRTKPGTELPVVDEESLVGLGLAAQRPLQLADAFNSIQDLVVV